MFDRAAITMGIRPHSSFYCYCVFPLSCDAMVKRRLAVHHVTVTADNLAGNLSSASVESREARDLAAHLARIGRSNGQQGYPRSEILSVPVQARSREIRS